jgi:hypothetical protein
MECLQFLVNIKNYWINDFTVPKIFRVFAGNKLFDSIYCDFSAAQHTLNSLSVKLDDGE